jgi:hypothetical protein
MRRTSLWIVPAVLLLLAGGGAWWLQAAQNSRLVSTGAATRSIPLMQASTTPPISWSVSKLTEIMFPGTSSTTKVNFRSNTTIQNVTINLTPSLNGIATVSPTSLPFVVANQDYQVTLTLKAPPEFIKREFGGTIQIRSGETAPMTYAVPLEIGLTTNWSETAAGGGLIAVKFPPQWTIVSNLLNLVLYSPEAIGAINSGDVTTPPDITITVLENSSGLQPLAFVGSYRIGWYSVYAQKLQTVVNGHSALIVNDLSSAIPHKPEVAAFVVVGSKMIIVTGHEDNYSYFVTIVSSIQ